MIHSLAKLLVKPRRPRLLATTFALAAILATITVALATTGAGERLELRTVDARFAERGVLDAPDDIVVVAIDRSQDSLGSAWPLSRQLWAQAITRLDSAGVAAIVIDVPFDTPALNPTEDADFLAAVAAAKTRIVFAHGSIDASGAAPGAPLAAVTGVTADHTPFGGPSARMQSADGTVRTYPVRAPAGIAAAAVAALDTDSATAALAAAPDELLLNWYGPRATFEHVSFADVAYGNDVVRDMRGMIAVVGPTEGIARDDHDVPIGSRMSSAEIQATAIANLLDGSAMRAPAPWVAPAAAALLAIAIWAMLLVLPLGVSVPVSLASIGGWGLLAVRMFDDGLVIPMLAPMLAGSVVFVTTCIALAAISVRERLRVKGLFARYVHADVVRELIDGEDRLELGGEEREITVLFSDIRGFTTMSEHVDPVEMVAQLNEYFEAMVDVVAAHDGTVDKFLGDGMMAIFGAPARRADHAARACATAVDMLDRLDDVNRDRAARNLAPLRIGIGIHTGRAVVGNVGSPPFRVDFTAIGDTVNLAARIESMTKELGVPIVATDDTVAAVSATSAGDGATDAPLAFAPLGSIVARGRSTATDVHAVTRAGDATPGRTQDADGELAA